MNTCIIIDLLFARAARRARAKIDTILLDIGRRLMLVDNVTSYVVPSAMKETLWPSNKFQTMVGIQTPFLLYRFSAYWLRSKCSICSYQLNI